MPLGEDFLGLSLLGTYSMWLLIARLNLFSDILGGEYHAQGHPDELYFSELITRALLYME